jgi:hypothetical protein
MTLPDEWKVAWPPPITEVALPPVIKSVLSQLKRLGSSLKI